MMLLHVLGRTISARSLTVAFRFTRSTAITTGTKGNVFTTLVLIVAIVSIIHRDCFASVLLPMQYCVVFYRERLLASAWMV